MESLNSIGGLTPLQKTSQKEDFKTLKSEQDTSRRENPYSQKYGIPQHYENYIQPIRIPGRGSRSRKTEKIVGLPPSRPTPTHKSLRITPQISNRNTNKTGVSWDTKTVNCNSAGLTGSSKDYDSVWSNTTKGCTSYRSTRPPKTLHSRTLPLEQTRGMMSS